MVEETPSSAFTEVEHYRTQLQVEFNVSQRRLSLALQSLAEEEEARTSLAAKLDEAKSKIEQAEKASIVLAQLEKQNKELLHENEELSSALGVAERKSRLLQDANAKVTQEHARLRQQVETLRQAVADKENELQSLRPRANQATFLLARNEQLTVDLRKLLEAPRHSQADLPRPTMTSPSLPSSPMASTSGVTSRSSDEPPPPSSTGVTSRPGDNYPQMVRRIFSRPAPNNKASSVTSRPDDGQSPPSIPPPSTDAVTTVAVPSYQIEVPSSSTPRTSPSPSSRTFPPFFAEKVIPVTPPITTNPTTTASTTSLFDELREATLDDPAAGPTPTPTPSGLSRVCACFKRKCSCLPGPYFSFSPTYGPARTEKALRKPDTHVRTPAVPAPVLADPAARPTPNLEQSPIIGQSTNLGQSLSSTDTEQYVVPCSVMWGPTLMLGRT